MRRHARQVRREKIYELPKDIFNFRAYIALYPDGSVKIFAEGVIV